MIPQLSARSNRAVPAAPQVLTFMTEGVGPPVDGQGLLDYAPAATVDGLVSQLCGEPPEAIVFNDQAPPLDRQPRLATLLAARYRLVATVGARRVYRLIPPP